MLIVSTEWFLITTVVVASSVIERGDWKALEAKSSATVPTSKLKGEEDSQQERQPQQRRSHKSVSQLQIRLSNPYSND